MLAEELIVAEKTCVITGASRGIGLATALRFAKGGYNIVIAARNPADLQKAAQRIADAGVGCEALPVDIASERAAEELIDVAVQRFGRIDVLVNNAGHAPLALIDETSVDQLDRALAVNVKAVFCTTRAAWPVMKRQQSGVIVNISSVASVDPFRGFAIYGACKAWVNLFTKATADEGRELGIRVYAVAPGAVETNLLRGHFPDFPADQTLDPDQVAGVVEAVCDERLQYASGQTVYVRA